MLYNSTTILSWSATPLARRVILLTSKHPHSDTTCLTTDTYLPVTGICTLTTNLSFFSDLAAEFSGCLGNTWCMLVAKSVASETLLKDVVYCLPGVSPGYPTANPVKRIKMKYIIINLYNRRFSSFGNEQRSNVLFFIVKWEKRGETSRRINVELLHVVHNLSHYFQCPQVKSLLELRVPNIRDPKM